MKHLILMNPVRRRRTSRRRRKLYGAALKAHQRRVGGGPRRRRRRRSVAVVHHRVRRRRVRRNPVAVRRSRRISPAVRAKISRAVRRSNRGRRVSRAYSRVTSAFRRRSSRRGIGGGMGNPFKQMFSKQVLTVAGGAVASSFITQFVLTRFGAQLPMSSQPLGRVAYKLIIPATGAMLVKRFNRDLASGMLIGGAVMAINELIAAYGPKGGVLAPVGSYGNEYDGDVGEGGMPDALANGDDTMAEYFNGEADFATQTFNGQTDNPFDSAPAFTQEF